MLCEVLVHAHDPPRWFQKQFRKFRAFWHCHIEVIDCSGNGSSYGMFGFPGRPLGGKRSLVKKADRVEPRNQNGTFVNPWVVSAAKHELRCPMCSSEEPCDLESIMARYPFRNTHKGAKYNCVTVTAWAMEQMGLPVQWSPVFEGCTQAETVDEDAETISLASELGRMFAF